MYSNWAELLLRFICKQYQVAITGNAAQEVRKQVQTEYLPHVMFVGGNEENLALLKGKCKSDETLIHVCTDGACLFPTSSVNNALEQVKTGRNHVE